MSDDHITVGGDSEYELTVHPAFASDCTVTDKRTGQARKLYEQDRSKPVDVSKKGHPKKHRIVLKGKNGKKRNITITIDDPEHAVHGITLDLYKEGRDPMQDESLDSEETFQILNHATTCPPLCLDPIP
jgi:hypothetical protein